MDINHHTQNRAHTYNIYIYVYIHIHLLKRGLIYILGVDLGCSTPTDRTNIGKIFPKYMRNMHENEKSKKVKNVSPEV